MVINKYTFYTYSFLLVLTSLGAANISWDVYDITGNVTDVSTTGTLVEARAGGNTMESFTINSVTFQPTSILDAASHEDTINARAGISLNRSNSDYYTLLRYGSRTSTPADQSITFQGLTVGREYEIQIWASDNQLTRDVADDEGIVLGTGSQAAVSPLIPGYVTLLYEISPGSTGQYGIGTFTADSSSQSFKLRRFNNLNSVPAGTYHTFVNAVQLRVKDDIPEPATLALLLAAATSIGLRRRP